MREKSEMAMARVSSGLAYPERFYAAASYAGFDGSSDSSTKGVSSKFSNDAALLLYALYQQVLNIFCWFRSLLMFYAFMISFLYFEFFKWLDLVMHYVNYSCDFHF